jgi:RNA polymerase sigma factor (sigma-70 family)
MPLVRAVAGDGLMETDGELLRLFTRHGETAAFDKLVERHSAMVWRVCRQTLRRQQDAEDAFQATFLLLVKGARQIGASESAAGWLFRVAYRTSLRARKRLASRREEALALDPTAPSEIPFPDLTTRQHMGVLAEELMELPLRYQTPLVMRYIEGQSRRAIAEATDVTVATVQGRLARGKQLLRRRLVRRGVSLSVAVGALSTNPRAEAATASTQLVLQTTTNATAIATGGSLAASVAVITLIEQGTRAMLFASLTKPAAVAAACGLAALVLAAPPVETTATASDGVVLTAAVEGEEADAPTATLQLAANEPASEGEPEALATGVAAQADEIRINDLEIQQPEKPSANLDWKTLNLNAFMRPSPSGFGLSREDAEWLFDEVLPNRYDSLRATIKINPYADATEVRKAWVDRKPADKEREVRVIAALIRGRETPGASEFVDQFIGESVGGGGAPSGSPQDAESISPPTGASLTGAPPAPTDSPQVTATLEAADEPAGTYPVGEMLVGPNTFLPSGKLPDLRIGDMARDGRKLTDAEQNEELRKRWAEAAKKDPPPVDGEPSLKELQLWHMYWEHRYDTLRSEAEKMRIAREKVPGSVSDSQVLTVAGDIFKARAEALRYERELKLRALKDGEPGASATGGEAEAGATTARSPIEPFRERTPAPILGYSDSLDLTTWSDNPDHAYSGGGGIDERGAFDTGGLYGKIKGIAGKTLDEAQAIIADHVRKQLDDPTVQVRIGHPEFGFAWGAAGSEKPRVAKTTQPAPDPLLDWKAQTVEALMHPSSFGLSREDAEWYMEKVLLNRNESLPATIKMKKYTDADAVWEAWVDRNPADKEREVRVIAAMIRNREARSGTAGSSSSAEAGTRAPLLDEPAVPPAATQKLQALTLPARRSMSAAALEKDPYGPRLSKEEAEQQVAAAAAELREQIAALEEAESVVREQSQGDERSQKMLKQLEDAKAERSSQLKELLPQGGAEKLRALTLPARQPAPVTGFVAPQNRVVWGPPSGTPLLPLDTSGRSGAYASANQRYGHSVQQLQQRLNEVLETSSKLDVDGDYGPKTVAAVRQFQSKQGLKPTGFADEETRRALGFIETASPPKSGVEAFSSEIDKKLDEAEEALLKLIAIAQRAAEVRKSAAESRNSRIGSVAQDAIRKAATEHYSTVFQRTNAANSHIKRATEEAVFVDLDESSTDPSSLVKSLARFNEPLQRIQLLKVYALQSFDSLQDPKAAPWLETFDLEKLRAGFMPQPQVANPDDNGTYSSPAAPAAPAVKSIPAAWPEFPKAPEPPKSDDPPPPADEASQRVSSLNHLREMMLTLLTLNSNHNVFPSVVEGGLSWRVELLPLLGYEGLYHEFHHDEPWDSPHNLTLLKKMPDVFRDPRSKLPAESGKTNYVAAAGQRAFMAPGQSRHLEDFRDGTSRTIALIEVGDEHAVEWTRPVDFDVEAHADDPRRGIGTLGSGGILVSLVDGSTRPIGDDVSSEALREMLLIDDASAKRSGAAKPSTYGGIALVPPKPDGARIKYAKRNSEYGWSVLQLQERLNEVLKSTTPLRVDGDYGPLTEAAVKEFQKLRELPVTGDVDERTRAALGFVEPDRTLKPVAVQERAKASSAAPQLKLGKWRHFDEPSLLYPRSWAVVAEVKDGESAPIALPNSEKPWPHFRYVRNGEPGLVWLIDPGHKPDGVGVGVGNTEMSGGMDVRGRRIDARILGPGDRPGTFILLIRDVTGLFSDEEGKALPLLTTAKQMLKEGKSSDISSAE